MPVYVEKVERVEDDLVAGDPLAAAAAERLLKRREVRPSLIVEDYGLPVEDKGRGIKFDRC